MLSRIVTVCLVVSSLNQDLLAAPPVPGGPCKSDKDCNLLTPYCGESKCRPVTTTCTSGELGAAGCNKCFCIALSWECTKEVCPPEKKFIYKGAVPCDKAKDLEVCKEFSKTSN